MSVDGLVMGGGDRGLGLGSQKLVCVWELGGGQGFPSTTNEQTTYLASHGDCRMVMTNWRGRIEKGRKEGERASRVLTEVLL